MYFFEIFRLSRIFSRLPSRHGLPLRCRRTVVADIGQRGENGSSSRHPPGQLGAHIIQRVGHRTDLVELLREELDIFEVHVEDTIFEFVQRAI
jgi:hypothetical protein